MGKGAWIFLSHSHKDFDQVKQIRNELEAQGHNPLMFFLKCLNDDSEIDDLIRREIMARKWFILCDSTNAQNARWVKAERKIIEGLSTHNSCIVNLDAPLDQQLKSIAPLMKQATVYLSYARPDLGMAQKIEEALREEDFGVFADFNLSSGSDWNAETNDALKEASKHGALLVLLSRASFNSRRQRSEILAFFLKANPNSPYQNIVPIFLDSPTENLDSLPKKTAQIFMEIHAQNPGVDFSTGKFTDNMAAVKKRLRTFSWES